VLIDIYSDIYSPLREVLYSPRGYWAKSNLVAKNCQKLVTKLFSSIYRWYAGIARGAIYNIGNVDMPVFTGLEASQKDN